MFTASVERSPDTFFALLDTELELRRITALTDELGILRKDKGSRKKIDSVLDDSGKMG